MIHFKRLVGGLLGTVFFTLHPVWADPATSSAAPEDSAVRMTLADFKAISSAQSRNYDPKQDISPKQMLRLLDVCERTEASLGGLLATGEIESAYTWNDFVRPTLPSGNLGAASGVWQFMPATFHRIIKTYGSQILSAAAADPATGRAALDLADGPFDDARVRAIIQSTLDGQRTIEDEELQLLRHNFTLLAFATIYLTRDSGATTPEETYLFHFLGEGMGRQVLALARGPARDTLSVDPVDTERRPPLESDASASATSPEPSIRPIPTNRPMPTLRSLPGLRESSLQPSLERATLEARRHYEQMRAAQTRRVQDSAQPAIPSAPPTPPVPPSPPSASSAQGLPADSAMVTGNPGMFYRDGKGRSQPYTWGEFMQNLRQRIRAHDQPALVRAKYGVGFDLAGGDMDSWTFDPDQAVTPIRFRDERGFDVVLPPMLLLETLTHEETRAYREALATLIGRGEDRPLDRLPADALRALRHLTALPDSVREGCGTDDPAVQQALNAFRRLSGKEAPDDPDLVSRLMPAERAALRIYDQRFSRYAALQWSQHVASGEALDLTGIMKMPFSRQRFSTFEISALQSALAERDLLKQPTKKVVWRDKKGKKHFKYQTLPFSGMADEATLSALNAFQWRQGLAQTQGVLDALTLGLLGLPAMGPAILEPLKGPACALEATSGIEPSFSPVDLEPPTPWFRLLGYHRVAEPGARFQEALFEPRQSGGLPSSQPGEPSI